MASFSNIENKSVFRCSLLLLASGNEKGIGLVVQGGWGTKLSRRPCWRSWSRYRSLVRDLYHSMTSGNWDTGQGELLDRITHSCTSSCTGGRGHRMFFGGSLYRPLFPCSNLHGCLLQQLWSPLRQSVSSVSLAAYWSDSAHQQVGVSSIPKAVIHFLPLIRSKVVLFHSDNSSAVAYLENKAALTYCPWILCPLRGTDNGFTPIFINCSDAASVSQLCILGSMPPLPWLSWQLQSRLFHNHLMQAHLYAWSLLSIPCETNSFLMQLPRISARQLRHLLPASKTASGKYMRVSVVRNRLTSELLWVSVLISQAGSLYHLGLQISY